VARTDSRNHSKTIAIDHFDHAHELGVTVVVIPWAGKPSAFSFATCFAVNPNRKKFRPRVSSRISMLAPSTCFDGQRSIHRELHVAGGRRSFSRPWRFARIAPPRERYSGLVTL